MKRIGVAAVWLVLGPLTALAQTRVGTVVTGKGSAAIGTSAITPAAISLPQMGAVMPLGSVSLSVSPAPALMNAANPVSPVAASPISAVTAIQPLSLVNPSGKVAPSVAVESVQFAVPGSKATFAAPATRSEKAVAVIRGEVADWGVARQPEDVLAPSFAQKPSALSPMSAAAAPETRPDVPAAAPAPAPSRARPVLSKSLLIAGASLVGISLAAAAMPALLPAAVVAWQGSIAWAGFASMAASRFWREPGSAPDVPRGPPAPDGGALSSFKTAWAAARDSAAAQRSFETRVGGSSWASFRDWLFGGLRTGLYWLGPALMAMLGGAVLAKAGVLVFGVKAAAAAAAGGASSAAISVIPLSTLLLGLVPMAIAAEAAGVALFFGVQWLARRLGAGRAAPWLGGAAALGLAGGVILSLTTAPFVVIVTLALEAGVIWSAARSGSFLVPLALRGVLTLFSLEAARLAAWLSAGAAGTLVGLPAVWGGVAIAALVALAWKFKAPGLRIAEIGAWWKADAPGQRPKSPGRILSAGLVWGLIVYALGDLTFWGVNALAPGHEPVPGILAKMLTSGVDLVLYNFVIVGLLEEYVFRRGLFKMMNDKLEKWGLSLGKAFWLAAIGSALIFSGVHYVDWGGIMAKIGMGDPASSSGLAGAYAFSWAGFVSRSVLGVLLAWMYKRSGLLLIPIVAHFWADSMEGLGLRWGMPAFLAMAAGALVLSYFFGRKAAKPKLS